MKVSAPTNLGFMTADIDASRGLLVRLTVLPPNSGGSVKETGGAA